MPTVPQYGQRQQISDLPTVRSNLNLTPDAFGAQIGRAGQGIAAQLGQYAEREQEKQDTAALMNAERELQSWQNQALFAPETGAYAQRGQNAFGIPDKLMPEWDKRVGEVESRLTDRQREVFRQRAGNMRVSMERDLMRHAGSEAEAFQKTETAALVGTRMETAMLYWKDPARFDQELREAQGVFLAGNDGLPPAALAAGMQEIESKGRAGVVQKMLEENPLEAQRYFDTWSEKMTAADRAAAERVLKPARIDAEADQEVARATGRGVAPVPPPSDYATYRRRLESGGRADAKNPNSSATGADQFTEGTWLDMVRKSKPAWADGLSRAQLLELRKDADKSAEMASVYDAENARALTKAGEPVTVHTLYASHHFGAGGGVAFARADMDTPMEDILSEEQIAANGYLRGKTKAEAIANWDKRAGARPGQAPAAAPPTDKAGVLTELNQITDPQVRAAAISKYNAQLQIEKVREAEIEQANVESINTKVEAADPAANLRNILTPQEYAWAAEQGKLPAWEARMAQRLNGAEPKTDPAVFDALQTVLARAENGDPVALAEVKKMDPTSLFTKLDKQARDYVQNRRLAIVGADAKKKSDTPDFATEDELLDVEVFGKLGISKNATKDEPEEDKATRLAFMQTYWAGVETRQAELGRKLSSGEKQAIMKELLLPFARKVQKDWWFDSEETKRGFEIGNVPAVDRQQIVEAFKRVHGVQPTDAQVRAAYLRAQGFTPKLEAE